MSFSSPVFQERTDMPCFHSGKERGTTFPRKSRTHTSERYLKISMLTKHLPRVTVHTRRPAGDPHRPGEYCGAREVRDDLFPTNATSPRHVVRASMSSMYFWIPGAEVPGGPALCRKPNSMRYVQRHQVPNWLMTSVRNIYRTDTLTTRNENFLCFNVGEEIIRRHCRKRISVHQTFRPLSVQTLWRFL